MQCLHATVLFSVFSVLNHNMLCLRTPLNKAMNTSEDFSNN